MITKARHDFIQVSYVYAGAIATVLFLSLIATPLKVPSLGIIAPTKETSSEVYSVEAFKDADVEAKAFIVYDLVDKKVIASKNAEMTLPLASISKMMTAFTALSGHGKDAKITIKPGNAEAGYDLGLKKNQVWSLGELLKYMLVFSSNDSAHAIADAFGGRDSFVEEMNKNSALLGLNLRFTDPAGLDVGGLIGGEGTALDVAKLFAAARMRFPEILDATTKPRVTVVASNGRLSGVPNTNQNIGNFLGAEVSKTGFTDNAGGNLAVVVDLTLGHPVAIVVLGSTREARFTDVEKLYKILLESSRQQEK
jgi:D-alanyl-D-alanine carboxypeptidase (penicillin-binding protein 5/6)